MSDAITPTLVDTIAYWAPGTADSTGESIYSDPQILSLVRVDDSVDKEIRDLLQGKLVQMTVWSVQPLEVGGWICRIDDFRNSDPVNATYPQMIDGAKQIVNVGSAKNYDRSRVFWRAVA